MRGLSVVLLVLLIALSGCSVHVPGVSADLGDDVHLDIGDGGHVHGEGGFCPPGQAKKGNC